MIDAWERERPAGSFFCSLLPSEHAKSIFSFEKVIARKCGRILNAPGEIRTHGLRIRNPALYPPELRGQMGFSACKLTGSALKAFFLLVIPTMQSQQKVNMA
jgi:hypothetical protein